jgi:filamentous hemagglutinin
LAPPAPKVTVNSAGITEIKPGATPTARQRELNSVDTAGSGRLNPAEAGAAAQLEPVLGGMQRYEGPPTNGNKAPDFTITNGPNAGKTVDMMYTTAGNTPKEIDGMNRFFERNMTVSEAPGLPPRGVTGIQDHLAKAEIVVMDFRTLTPQNQQLVLDYLRTLPTVQQAQIRIIK